jgi:hypothetical protein
MTTITVTLQSYRHVTTAHINLQVMYPVRDGVSSRHYHLDGEYPTKISSEEFAPFVDNLKIRGSVGCSWVQILYLLTHS